MAADLLFKPAGELAALVRSGDITARELTEAALERIQALDGELNAFVHVDAEGALATAADIGAGDRRPFAGVPIAIKDTAAVAGLPHTLGSDLFGDFRPQHDSFVVRRLKEAGFVIVGKTNLPEFGILPVTEPRRHGPTRNPWDTARTSGGSSGGAAAAVAAGLVPIAHGSDGGGSIRIPAACCGLVGLKPSRGRISRGPDQGDDFLVQDGVLTRTVAETAELLDLLAGYEPGDATWAPPPDEPFAATAARDPGRLRIGVTTDAAIPSALDPQCASAVRDAADLLAELGHEVEEIDAPWKDMELLRTFTLIFLAPVAAGVHRGAELTEREPAAEHVEPLTWTIWNEIRQRNPVDYLLARNRLTVASREILAVWERCDVVLVPSLAQRPVPIGTIDACSDDPWADFRRSGEFTPYTALFNVTGQPAISLPLFQGDDGLPLGVQLAGRPAREGALLALAGQIEAARPWADRRPPQAQSAAAASTSRSRS